ncbi:uncharacterized protein LOC116800687 [Drosophila sechellia]|uniref:uncharacterized protein LOC116800687 n=1 Tax=Drosophila sechellia TaxID=7238 RepID=UPI0013DDB933|nr:uncharacterized protein LOC116800687 [Drosophila sechellia]
MAADMGMRTYTTRNIIQAKLFSPQQQQGADVAASLKELQGEMAHPLGSQCVRDCLAEKGSLVLDPLGECQQVEQQFDCTLYCMFDVEPRY